MTRARWSGLRWLVALSVVSSCAGQPVTGYAAPGPWRLMELKGERVPAGTTLSFPKPGRVEGTLPCNAFSAQQTAPYPWFILSHFEVAPGTCAAIELENRIVHSLASVTRAESKGGILVLSSDAGRELVFRLD